MKKQPTRKRISEKMMDVFELPKNKTGIISAVHITGIHEVMIEGHKGIIEYCESIIRLNTTQFIIKISGKNMEISSLSDEIILIKGIISAVEYEL